MNYKNKIILYIFILLTLIGCKGKESNKDTIKKKDIAPKTLKDLSKEMDSIMLSIGDIEKINLGIDQEEKGNLDKKDDKSSKESENKESKEEDSQGEDKLSSQTLEEADQADKNLENKPTKEEMKNEKIDLKWKDIDKSLEKLYNSWNEYGPKAMKDGANSDHIGEIEDSFSRLTKGVEERELLTIYNYGSKSYKAYKDLYGPYRDEIGGEVSSLKYMVYQYYLNGIKNSTKTALLFISDSEDEINSIRLKLEDKEDKIEKIDKISFGFKSLSNPADEKSVRLLMLKKDALIKNINSLEN